jgi:hypothetical protein
MFFDSDPHHLVIVQMIPHVFGVEPEDHEMLTDEVSASPEELSVHAPVLSAASAYSLCEILLRA